MHFARHRRSRSAFTLLEIMLVVIIIALLGASAIYFMGDNVGFAEEVRIKNDIQLISTQLQLYRAMSGFLPSTEQGLEALVVRPTSEPKPRQWRPLFEKLPTDPHSPTGSTYQYIYPGKRNPTKWDVWSVGPDKKDGTEDDIGNW